MVGSGDNTYHPHPQYVYTPPSALRLYPPPPAIYSVLHPTPFPFINHAITFSYTCSDLSITISYSMVGVKWCATLLRGKFVYISAITLLLFFTCIVYPSLPIVSLSPSIDVISIYYHFLFVRRVEGGFLSSILPFPTPFIPFPVSYPFPVTCHFRELLLNS